MKKFISCDWGTSSFRLRLIDAETKAVLAESKSAEGSSATYRLWKETGKTDRLSFYSNIILNHIALLEIKSGSSLNGVAIIISGMASSSIGMIELPYKSIPFNIHNSELETHIIPAAESLQHTMIIISGVRSSNDVMRGEETKLVGCNIGSKPGEQLFIFPGTHPKHVFVQNGMLKDFKTYMTGEVFELLNTKSILSASVESRNKDEESDDAFIKGVIEAVDSNVLNSIFHVRTNQLFGKLDSRENYQYLSGLLIGEELKTIRLQNFESITIVSEGKLMALYKTAFIALGFAEKLSFQNADEALINGQAAIFKNYQ